MIKLEKVNKYFNRFKKNQIHVINNTSLELGESGLVAFLGESGCGKTTLLNAIGGLNRINNGKIFINGKKLPKKCGYRKDKIRTLNIGYIFQDYNLIDDMSVFDNISLSLKMIGIKDKRIIKERVNYVLEKVDMYRFRNRMAGALSGGQRQRVGIARAIVKNPSIIIADEPTGNLDSKNTIEIMNIIKSISQEKLVILVTHEKNIAKFYASKIINLEDGRIVNIIEDNDIEELDYRMDNKIYLKDFEVKEKFNNKNYNINIYSSKQDKINIDIIIKGGNIYINNKDTSLVEVIDNDSNIEVVNDSYKKITKDDYLTNDFDLSKLSNENMRIKYKSVYNPITMIKDGINRVMNYKLIKKILLFGFFVSSMFIVYGVSNIAGVTRIEDKKFITTDRNYVYVTDFNRESYEKLKNIKGATYVIPGDSIFEFSPKINDIYQFKNTLGTIKSSVVGLSTISEKDLIRGNMPSNNKEIVIDKFLFDTYYKAGDELCLKLLGINNIDKLIDLNLSIGNATYKIVGVSDMNTPSIYINENEFQNLLINKESYRTNELGQIDESIDTYKIYDGANITLKKGNLPVNDYEVIVNISEQESMPLNKEINKKINGKKLKVVGYYDSIYEDNSYYVNSNMLNYIILKNNKGYSIYTTDKQNLIKELNKLNYNGKDVYSSEKEKYVKSTKKTVRNSLIISGIILIISFVEIFFMIRASFLTKIKEVGIKRAIGIKKLDIYKMFIGEILVITTITGIPGVIVMSSFLKELAKVVFFESQYIVNNQVIIISFILIYGLNIIIGLLPLYNLLRKEPADILSRNDVN